VLAYAAHEDPEDIGALEFKLAELRPMSSGWHASRSRSAATTSWRQR
jgi:hypothetical protein